MPWTALKSAFLAGLLTTLSLSIPALAADEAGGAKTRVTPPWDLSGNPAAEQKEAIFADYRFRDGETLPQLRVHYATLGKAHRDGHGEIDNAILVLHWTGADGRAVLSPEYTKALYDAGRPLDASKYYLIFVDNVGHGQSSKPSDGLKANFPRYGYNDMVDIQHKLVSETLGIKRLHAILGMSMGGMNAWQYAEAYPDEVEGVMPVVSLPVKVSGRNLLWRRMLIDDIRSDPEWNGGNYTKPPQGWVNGYGILRLMIEGVPHLQAIIANADDADHFIAATRGQAGVIDANNVLYSISSSGDYDPEPKLSSIKAKLFALNFDDDEFNPDQLHLLEQLMPKVPHGRYVVQKGSEKSFGHLTMVHPALWADHVGEFMHWLEAGSDRRASQSSAGSVRRN
jgi:homoserine O-acetyltransferase/O-succinyltransferase